MANRFSIAVLTRKTDFHEPTNAKLRISHCKPITTKLVASLFRKAAAEHPLCSVVEFAHKIPVASLARILFDHQHALQLCAAGNKVTIKVYSAMSVTPNTTPLVARENEMHELMRAYAKLHFRGSASYFFVGGEPGIGKTTFVQSFLDRLRDQDTVEIVGGQPLVLRAQCNGLSSAPSPYAPISELLDDIPVSVDSRIREWAQELSPKLIEGLVPYFGPLLGEVLRKEIAKSGSKLPASYSPLLGPQHHFIDLFRFLGNSRTLIVFVDDIHWADESTLDLIFALARQQTTIRLLFIATFRTHEVSVQNGNKQHPLAKILSELKRYGLCSELTLNQLTLVQTTDFVRSRFPQNAFESSFIHALHRETNGIPFFLDQLLQLLVENGKINRKSGGEYWQASDLSETPIPQGAIAVVKTRLALLSTSLFEVLQIASVVGQEFDADLIASVLQCSAMEVVRSFRVLHQTHGLISPRILNSGNRRRQTSWQFSHAYVQRAIYEDLILDERLRIHSLVSDEYLKETRNEAEDTLPKLAYHFEQSGRLAEAISARVQLATRSHNAWNWPEQMMHCSKALEMMTDVAGVEIGDQIAIWTGLIDGYRRSANFEGMKRAGMALINIKKSKAIDSESLSLAHCEGHFAMLEVARLSGDVDGVLTHATERWQIASHSGSEICMLAFVNYFQYESIVADVSHDCPSLQMWLEQVALQNFGPNGSNILQAAALRSLGILCYCNGQDELAVTYLDRAIEVARTIDPARLEELALRGKFINHFLNYGAQDIESDCIEIVARVQLRAGDSSLALQSLRRVLEIKTIQENKPGMAGLLNVIAETQCASRKFEDAEVTHLRSLEIAREVGSNELFAMILSTGLTIALEKKAVDLIENRLKALSESCGDTDIRWIWYKCQLANGHLLSLRNNPAAAVDILLPAAQCALRENEMAVKAHLDLAIAEAKIALHDYETAKAFASNSLETCSKLRLSILCKSIEAFCFAASKMANEDDHLRCIELTKRCRQSKV